MSEVRNKLNSDEYLEDSEKYGMLFLSGCCGIGLKKRGHNDNHICFVVLSEDDEHWFTDSDSRWSSAWMEAFMAVSNAAQEWLEKNGEPDICETGYAKGHQFGWKFKKDEMT